MATPTTFPAWLSKPGAQDTLVLDAAGFNAAIAQGYTFSDATTAASLPAPPGVAVTISETSKSAGQRSRVFEDIANGKRH
jgi:hypothetical protein